MRLTRYLLHHRRPAELLAVCAAFFLVAPFSFFCALADRTASPIPLRWPVLASMGVGWLAGEWLGRWLTRRALPPARISTSLLASNIVIHWLSVSRADWSVPVATALVYLVLFTFSRPAETLLRTVTPRRLHGRLLAAYGTLFAGGVIAGLLAAGYLWSSSPPACRLAARVGVNVLGMVWLTTVIVRYRRAPAGPAQWFLFHVGYFLARGWHGLREVGRCRLPVRGGAVLAATHVSGVDPLLLQTSCRRPLRWMMAREYYEIRGLGWFYRLVGCVPVDRGGQDTAATRAALRLLEAGQVVAIFPAGRIADDPANLPPLKDGAALLAIRQRVPLIPAVIRGIGHRSVAADWLRPHRGVKIRFGRPIDLGDLYDRPDTRQAAAEATGRLSEAMARLAAECDAGGARETRRRDSSGSGPRRPS